MKMFFFECERAFYNEERILYIGERFLYLYGAILFYFFLENFSLGKYKSFI